MSLANTQKAKRLKDKLKTKVKPGNGEEEDVGTPANFICNWVYYLRFDYHFFELLSFFASVIESCG